MGEHLALAEHVLDSFTSEDEDLAAQPRPHVLDLEPATAAFEIRVHGVVVQTRSWSPGSSGDSGIWITRAGSRIGSFT